MELNQIKAVYFIGIGGIGMSAIARYFLHQNIAVGGYDRAACQLTRRLEEEGAQIHYEEDVNLVPDVFKNPKECLVVYTPAIPNDHKEMAYFRNHGFEMEKRAQVLGRLSMKHKALCVAGTHGKTTTSTMAAHLLHQSNVGCNAFLGGISKNYGTNYLLSANSEYVVIEADEFDRSFHWLRPYATVITATDADHLDIYGTYDAYLESFAHYTSLVQPGGALIIHEGLALKPRPQDGVRCYTYSRDKGDIHAENIRIGNGDIIYDYVSPFGCIKDVKLGVPVEINIENSMAAMALAQIAGVADEDIKKAMATFGGVDRRFDFQVKNERVVLLSDYAHHPAEIASCARSMRALYPDKKISAIFQPHLYTRTRDFYKDFAKSLSLLDEVILLEIYPAREAPIEGVTSQLIYDNLSPQVERTLCPKSQLVDWVKQHQYDVLIVLGAGDIEGYLPALKEIFEQR